MTVKRIAVIASHDVPTIGRFAKPLREAGLDVTIVYNDKRETPKNMEIWRRRTLDRLPPLPLDGIPVTEVGRISSPEGADVLRRYDLALNGGLLEILKPVAFEAPSLGVLNVHPGVLPKYRGSSAVEWSLFNGDPVGVTAHIMDAGIDTGPIVRIRHVDTSGCRSYQDIRIAAYEASFACAAEAAVALLAGTAVPEKQGEGTYWSPIDDTKLAQVIQAAAKGVGA